MFKKVFTAIYLVQLMLQNVHKKIALVTGSAGFIGFISKRLLNEGWQVFGVDCV